MCGRRVLISYSMAMFGLVGLLIASCSNSDNQDSEITSSDRSLFPKEVKTMKLKSSAFNYQGFIPSKYTCDGEDISPALTWDEVPTGTQSIALIVDDPDAPRRTFVHWVVYDIPATTRQLPEQITSQNLKGVQGKNDFGKLGYGGPCPPSGIHRYFFKVYALDKQLGLAAGATKDQILAAMEGHILAQAELIGKYKH